jgi:hypothetical protein
MAKRASDVKSGPEDYQKLLVKVLAKRTQDRQTRFPHLQGAIYFSLDTVKSAARTT